MASIRIEFSKGGIFVARLLEADAPKTCYSIKAHLPFQYEFHHSIVSGEAIVALPKGLAIQRENQRVAGISAGTLAFLVRDDTALVPDEIYISYGIFMSRGLTLDMKQPVNVFGVIETETDGLRPVCQRILMQGAETVRFSPER